ncbi:hypothetical protein M3P05_17310 [Sansalvadorimonas sp. 2012CJ34-2]|uniref:Uncharacterized protein n=1 Tax=Parendozoicomonas callyspongiae TaxID=2942213 RepID=A0ABT0PJZ8_9GAMM|nr:hypothetical protein [Sansalvadorimonas sp. 2012CJ34-2]MCL6271679.1 hypothetical protein [Sansalvadorimonas sp. 2012CJ34-2]
MAAIGQELLNVPMGDMIKQMATAIADAQYELDENSINVAEMMGGLTTVYDEKGEVSFDDSRVFFGYDYMSMKEARAYALIDDALTGTMGDDVIKLDEMLDKIQDKGKDVKGEPITDDSEIRVPIRMSMMELGFTPTFYQFVDTIIEVKIAIKITRTKERKYDRSKKLTDKSSTYKRKRSFWGTSNRVTRTSTVNTSQVDASYSSKYSFSAEGASLLRTKLTPVPPPAVLEERIRNFMEHEEQRKQVRVETERKKRGLDTPEPPKTK